MVYLACSNSCASPPEARVSVSLGNTPYHCALMRFHWRKKSAEQKPPIGGAKNTIEEEAKQIEYTQKDDEQKRNGGW